MMRWPGPPKLAPLVCAVALLMPALGAGGPAAQAARRVMMIDLDTIIHPLTGEIVAAGLQAAGSAGDEAVVLRLDTPGGMLQTTNEIVQAILASPVPVIAYVSPSGGHAASAGFIILVSADVAAMAPGTNTGAAQPVLALGGELQGTMKEKVENDTAASLRAVTDKRGRNSELAEDAVLNSASFTEEDALESNLIDVVAKDVDDLLAHGHARAVVRIDGTQRTLELADAETYSFVPNLRQRTLLPFVDPSLALLVLALGAAGVYIEFTNPGLVVPGVAGGILLILGLLALSLLPINIAGAALALLALALFVAEAFTPTNGILATGGVIAMVLGLVILVDTDVPELQVGWPSAIGITLPFAAISVFLLQLAIRSFRLKAATGGEAMVGEIGEARSALAPEGKVFVHGELWNARAASSITEGESVRIVAVDGMWLEVEPNHR
ncbi:MAG: nodulation protein NfeD [Bryobacterales bacterium]|nr:nodulation protein NfeD [Bryobacterales bacterium]